MKITREQVEVLTRAVGADIERSMEKWDETGIEPLHGELRWWAGRSDVPDWQIDVRIAPIKRDDRA